MNLIDYKTAYETMIELDKRDTTILMERRATIMSIKRKIEELEKEELKEGEGILKAKKKKNEKI